MLIRNRFIAFIVRIILAVTTFFGVYYNVFDANGHLIVHHFAFYTVLSNLFCFLYCVADLPYVAYNLFKKGASYSENDNTTIAPKLKGAFVMMITITFLIFHFLLVPEARIGNPNYSPFDRNSLVAHYIVPNLFLLDWLIIDKKGLLKWFDPIIWLLVPIIYFVGTIVRVEIVGKYIRQTVGYAYFFIDLRRFGVGAVMMNVLYIAIGFFTLGMIFFAIDKFLGKLLNKKK